MPHSLYNRTNSDCNLQALSVCDDLRNVGTIDAMIEPNDNHRRGFSRSYRSGNVGMSLGVMRRARI